MKLGGILALTAALILTGCTQAPPPPSVPDIQAKADAYEARLKAEAETKAAAYKERITATFKRTPDKPLRVLYLGDSVTMGSYTSDESLRWPNLVSQGMRASGAVDETVVARGGVTSAQGMEDAPDSGEWDAVFILFGNNDQYRGTLDGFKTDYPALVAKAKELSPAGDLVCVSPFLASTLAQTFSQVVRDSCEAVGGAFVDIGPVADDLTARAKKGDPYYGGVAGDNGHPNDKGHKAIADQVLSQVAVS